MRRRNLPPGEAGLESVQLLLSGLLSPLLLSSTGLMRAGMLLPCGLRRS